jgi:hypothetical protein
MTSLPDAIAVAGMANAMRSADRSVVRRVSVR